jgi:hypothetical protein
MKSCGSCSLCCKLIEVPGLAEAGKWCPHCKPGSSAGGCTIHADRPEVCQGWHCFWRAEEWPDGLRPDRCKVIFEALPGVMTILVSVEPSRPDSWKTKRILNVMDRLRKKGRPLVVKTKNDSVIFLAEGYSKADVLRDINKVIAWKEKMNGNSDIHH